MSVLTSFVSDPRVHDTVLVSMVITSFLAAIRRFKTVTNFGQLLWNFFYDWATGFWSLKTGHPLPPTIDPGKTQDPNPISPETPAQPTK